MRKRLSNRREAVGDRLLEAFEKLSMKTRARDNLCEGIKKSALVRARRYVRSFTDEEIFNYIQNVPVSVLQKSQRVLTQAIKNERHHDVAMAEALGILSEETYRRV